jgi:hypothetical protein
MLVELGWAILTRLAEILIPQLRVDDPVAVMGEERRFDAARNRLPAVENQDFHLRSWASVARTPVSV